MCLVGSHTCAYVNVCNKRFNHILSSVLNSPARCKDNMEPVWDNPITLRDMWNQRGITTRPLRSLGQVVGLSFGKIFGCFDRF